MTEVIATRHVGQGHLKPLDGVRGVAILMVICSHAFTANFESGGVAVRFLGNLLGYGLFGVDLFFVLSGFLITGILVDSVSDEGYFSKFYARRVLRIFPLYYGVLLALFVLTPLLRLQWHGMGWLLLGYLQNFRPQLIMTFSPGAGVSLNHFWSLAIEEQFYLVWPALVFLIRDRRTLLWTTLGGATVALLLRLALFHMGFSQDAIHVNTLARADSLLLGGTFALLYRSRYWDRVMRMAPLGFLVTMAILVVSIFRFGGEFTPGAVFSHAMSFWINGPRYTVLAVCSACLLAWSLRPESACKWLFEQKWLRFFGKYSYGIYVLHMIVLGPMVIRLRAVLLQVTHSKLLAVIGAGFLWLTLAVSAAYLCFHLYEKPFLRLKRYFDYKPRSGKEASVERSAGITA
ncbi:acyltransferase family protein [Granulicella arctica]|uniref:acyltransferase family protein n=1 Tax=Granulicella arctica TaxID=940613 RepID=UPI0021E07C95|nr:acyltransferase [Granulicella arctica]